VIGGLFPEFTYGTSSALLGRSVNPGQADLASGLALTVVAALIFAVHFGMDYMIDKRLNLKNPLMHKIFNTFGLFTSGFILFGSLITFVIALASSSASSLSRPGATLAVVLAAVPVWVYYLVQSMMAMRRER
jgi:hypothetical protein